ncbi:MULTISPECIES: outer membrane homotrimeric porin [unclassified Maridesulfovibrio]|uniref:outer membrane homotrimeric porin n=1 Tax=unclassified Maridesulfovibrio TaxID=2794999 RepID=UPI003B419821
MKKLTILAILTTMVLGFAASSYAVDLDAKGKIQFQMNIIDNQDFLSNEDGGNNEDDLNFWFRARTEFRFVASENLWAVLYTEYKNRIGNGHVNVSTNDDDDGLYVKRAYMQFRYPGTEVLTSAGILSVNLPGAASNNMVLGDADLGAFMVESPITDQIAIAGAFIRNSDRYGVTGDGATNKRDELDIFYAALPITIDGISATPYFAYSIIGDKSVNDAGGTFPGFAGPVGSAQTKNANAWWLGTSFSMDMFDPIIFKADVVYGAVDADAKENDRSGLLCDASLAYTGLDFVQPKLLFAYSTGEDDDTDNGSERLPIISNDWAFGTTYFGGSALTETDFDNVEQIGFWTVGLSLEKISFFENLSHDVHFLYIQGTNDAGLVKNHSANLANITDDGNFLTDEDYAIEIDFNTNYQIYDELAAIVEFGYVDVDLDEDTWQNVSARGGKTDPMLKVAFGLVYSF